jgi:hypothetical protein
MQVGDVLRSRAIQEIEIEIGPEYERVCCAWLERQGCRVSRVRPGWYAITFPVGTREETRLGQSGLYTRRSYIVLPSHREMPLYVASPINPGQRTRVTLGFPVEIFP